jgi:hypothetical protein
VSDGAFLNPEDELKPEVALYRRGRVLRRGDSWFGGTSSDLASSSASVSLCSYRGISCFIDVIEDVQEDARSATGLGHGSWIVSGPPKEVRDVELLSCDRILATTGDFTLEESVLPAYRASLRCPGRAAGRSGKAKFSR